MRNDVHAAYILVDYAWAVLSANDAAVWDKAKYGGMVPIVPLSEEAELDAYEGPHIVYGFADSATGGLHARNEGAITFAVYDQNFRRLTRTMNILRVAFERQDESARDINNFSTTFNPGAGPEMPYLGIRFGYTDIGFVDGGTPEDTEGARQSALVSIRYEYYAEYPNIITDVL